MRDESSPRARSRFCYHRILLVVVLEVAAVAIPPRDAAAQSPLWAAFRYDDARVLFYAATRVDSVAHPLKDVMAKQLPSAAARYGAGGYLLELSPERLTTLRPYVAALRGVPPPEPASVPALGSPLRLMLGGDVVIPATVEAYVEQWGSENPIVRVGVLARIAPTDLPAFRRRPPDYFLIEVGDAAALTASPSTVLWNSSEVLNRFANRGQLVLHRADAGWCVALEIPDAGGMRPSAVSYCYGD